MPRKFANIALSLLFAVLVVATGGSVRAGEERGTREEAVAMAERAATRIKAVGKDAAMAEFNDLKNTEFHAKDLYVVAIDYKGNVLAHGTNAGLRGKNLWELKDVNSKLFVQEQIKTGQSGSGWTDFMWTDPMTKKIQPKSFYSIGMDDYYVGVGIYKLD